MTAGHVEDAGACEEAGLSSITRDSVADSAFHESTLSHATGVDSHSRPSNLTWEYWQKLLLAPMVRINTLPFRLLAAECGADIVYSEELVDRSILSCHRAENKRLGTIDFRHDDGKLIFSTVPHEKVAFQLGTASGTNALLAAQVIAADVRAIDINMGCPVKFSTQGGMGSALLTQPEKVKEILRTLVSNMRGKPITCKIRLLDSPAATLQLARVIEDTGVSALAVHARRRDDRPRHWAQWDQFKLLRETLSPSLPLVLNGDVFTPQDIPRAFESTGADALMLARGAMWNPSLFDRSSATLRPQSEMLHRYLELAQKVENPFHNTKYVATQMLTGCGKSPSYQAMTRAKDFEALRAAVETTGTDPVIKKLAVPPSCLEPPPDMPEAVKLPINAWRPVPTHWHAAQGQAARAKKLKTAGDDKRSMGDIVSHQRACERRD